MSFTGLLLLAYTAMSAGAFIAFRQKRKAIGAALLLAMLSGILVLGYLWLHSPM